jgi:ubiquitin-conjugating enzyme E2 J1
MAGDAKGQVGGLDMHPQAREKLAKESRAWRCAVCGKANEEIMKETEEIWKERGEDVKKEEVPEELRLAFREELEGGKEGGTIDGKRKVEASAAMHSSATAGARSSQQAPTSPGPTRTIPASQTRQSLQPATPRQPPSPAQRSAQSLPAAREGLPKWIDAAIVGLAVALFLMVIRRWAGAGEEDY